MSLPKSGKISLSEISVNFKPSLNDAPHGLSEYYRGGKNVRNFLGNLNIPVGGKVAFSDYYGTGYQNSYDYPIPELCTDSFYTYGVGVEDWQDIQDSPKEYVGRDNTSASIAIPVYHPQVTIEIPSLQFNIGSELGGDTEFSRVFRNLSRNSQANQVDDTFFGPGDWQIIVPKKFKRFRLIITSAGGSGSIQKFVDSGNRMTNKTIHPILEDGYDGGLSKVWTDKCSVIVSGGKGGGKHGGYGSGSSNALIYQPTVTVSGGIKSSYANRESDLPKDAVNYSKPLSFFDGRIVDSENAAAPINIIYRPKDADKIGASDGYRTGGRNHDILRPDGQGGESLFSVGGLPGPEYIVGNEDIAGNLNRVGSVNQLQILNLPSISGKLDATYGAGGAAGQHGDRGSAENGYKSTQGGQAGITAYLGDFECDGGDIINIKVGTGGIDSWNEYQDFVPASVEQNYTGDDETHTSHAGFGGSGSVQIIGSHGFLSSTLTHAGWVLEDDKSNIMAYSYAGSTSIKGVDYLQDSMTSPKTVELMGTSDPETPRMYYLRFSARISKNGDFPMKTRLCHVGKKSVKVTALAKTLFTNPVDLTGHYIQPDMGEDTEQVTGIPRQRGSTDEEIIDNWFISKCTITLNQNISGSNYANTARFIKDPLTDEGIGPDSFTIGALPSNPYTFTMSERERYVLHSANMSGSGRSLNASNRLLSYVYSKGQMGLDETSVDGVNSWANADTKVTYEGMGGFYVDGNGRTCFACGVRGTENSNNISGTLAPHTWTPPPPPPRPIYPPGDDDDDTDEGGGSCPHGDVRRRPSPRPAPPPDKNPDRKIVCTEMYRQTQLEDWKKTIKIWDVYQKRHLTPYHEIGYHWLFRPYVNGMKKSNILTKLGAYLAKRRTQHLKHVLTKGKSPDNIIGNIWCKICHPTVYITGKLLDYLGSQTRYK